jgi:hypothetical protein
VRTGRKAVGLLVACVAGGGLISQVPIVGAATSRSAVHAAVNALSLTQRVLSAGEFAGMKPSASPSVTTGAAAWAAGNASQAKQLRALDFIAGVRENLVTSGNQNRYGLSLVMKFKSASDAASELKSASGRQDSRRRQRRFHGRSLLLPRGCRLAVRRHQRRVEQHGDRGRPADLPPRYR